MGSRIREKPEHFFEVFVEIAKPEGIDDAPFIIQKYPSEFDDKEALMMIPKFAYPCKTEVSTVEHFTFVLTDIDSMFRFGYCRHATGHQTCLCIVSCLPWFEIFYKLLDLIADITNKSENNNVTQLLEKSYNQDIPAPRIPVTIVANENMFSFTPPDPNVLPSLSSNRNLKEYYSAVDHENMMKIFASMLHERRIYMISKKLSRLTASIHAAESMLYPMHWQHLYIPILPSHLIDYISAPMPYLIGVHKNLVEKLTQNRVDVGDAVVVDLDTNTVTSSYDDLEDLPHDVSNFLKKKLKKDTKNTMLYSGDAVSKAFLQAIVRLIGGYRDALKFRQGEAITFDPEAFVQSRPSESQPFLEGMLSLQIFQQFIRGRLEKLETGFGFTDIFDEEANKYNDKLHSIPKYKDFIKSAKKSGSKSILKITEQGRKAVTHVKTKISGLTETEEKKGTDFRASGGVIHSKPVSHTSSLKAQRPPRPPPPNKSLSKPETRNELHVEDALDDSTLRLSYHSPDVSLMGDMDIQAAMFRSASAEMLPQHYTGRQGSSGSCSTPSSESVGDNDIPFDTLHSSDEDSAVEPVPEKKIAETPTFVLADKLIRPQSDRLIRQTVANPIPPPREKKLHRTSPQTSPAATLRNPPTAAPRRSSLNKSTTGDMSAAAHDTPLIKFDSTDSETPVSDMFDPLAATIRPKEKTEDDIDGKGLMRNHSSRVSLTRSQAFKRDSPVIVKARLKEDDDPDVVTSRRDSTTDIFDPLSSSNKAEEPSLVAPLSDPLSHHSPRRESSDLLLHEWSVASLPRGPNITLPVGHVTLFPTPAFNMTAVNQSLPQNPAFDSLQPRATSMVHSNYGGQSPFQRVSLPSQPMSQTPGKLPPSMFAPYVYPQTSKLPQYQTITNLSSPKLNHGSAGAIQPGSPLNLSAKNSPTVSPAPSRSTTPAIISNKQSDPFGDLLSIGFGNNSYEKVDTKLNADNQTSQKSKWETFD
ncbi:DENN domain-containing protein 1A [Bulinus truncatus]|nr:DENN domain-containing protein 1A [Bulinus truncatus]